MRIQDSSNFPSQLSPAQSVAAKSPYQTNAAASASTQTSGSDEVSLSGVSRILSLGSSDRTSFLASLASSVRSGQYDVSSLNISQSLVSETLARANGS